MKPKPLNLRDISECSQGGKGKMRPIKVRWDKKRKKLIYLCRICEGEYDSVYCPKGICPKCNQILHESKNIFDAIGKIMKRKLRNQEKWRKEEK